MFTVYDHGATGVGFTVAGDTNLQVFLTKNQIQFTVRDGLSLVKYAKLEIKYENNTSITDSSMLPDAYSNNDGRIMFYPPEAGKVFKYRVYALGLEDYIVEPNTPYDVGNNGMEQFNTYYDEGVNTATSVAGVLVRPVDMVQVCYVKFYGPGAGQGKIFYPNGTEITPATRMTNATYNTSTRELAETLYTEQVFALAEGTYNYTLNGTEGEIEVKPFHFINSTTGQIDYGFAPNVVATPTEVTIKKTNGINTNVEFDYWRRVTGNINGDNVYYIGTPATQIPVTFTLVDESSAILPNKDRFPHVFNNNRYEADLANITGKEVVGLFMVTDESGARFIPVIGGSDYNTTILQGPENSPGMNYTGIFFGNAVGDDSKGEATVGMTSGTFSINALYPGYRLDLTHNHTITLNEVTISVITVYMVKDTTRFVTYNGNGNTGGELPMISHTSSAGVLRKVPVEKLNVDDEMTVSDSGTLVREDYTFKGWNTRADGRGTSYAPGALIKYSDVASGDLTLYAQWEYTPAPTHFNVTYDAGIAAGVAGVYVPRAVTVPAGDSYTITKARASADGYVFTGWADAYGVPVKGTITVNADTTLYAQWTALSGGFDPKISDLRAAVACYSNGANVAEYDLNGNGQIDPLELVMLAQYVADHLA